MSARLLILLALAGALLRPGVARAGAIDWCSSSGGMRVSIGGEKILEDAQRVSSH